MAAPRENPAAIKAGALSLLVHGLFFLLLVVSLNWRHVQPMAVAEVELWEQLPVPEQPVPPPAPEPQPKVETPPEPRPEPPPPPEPKAEIVVKPKPRPPERVKPKVEKKVEKKKAPKPDPMLNVREEEKQREEALRKLQQDLLEDVPVKEDLDKERSELAARAQRAAAANAALDKYRAGIQAKIRRYVTRQVCGRGKPVLEFSISLMPTGEVNGSPRLMKSSDIPACDQAVERAILQAQPLPVPSDPDLFAQFRDLGLQFRPNDDN